MDINVGMYVRTEYGIAKIIDKEVSTIWVLDKDIMLCHTSDNQNLCTTGQILDADKDIARLLRPGDFIDRFCIEDIQGTTIHTEVGYFIDFEDVEDMVTRIVTKEQFEKMGYEVRE